MKNDQSDDERWRLVASRDKSARGFVYAVSGTGIYCLPGCPSRLPRRENVRFFATPSEAELAGFRPCKRCRPGSPRQAEEAGTSLLESVRAALDTADTPPRIADLAEAAGLRNNFV